MLFADDAILPSSVRDASECWFRSASFTTSSCSPKRCISTPAMRIRLLARVDRPLASVERLAQRVWVALRQVRTRDVRMRDSSP